jgi:hypothetical protein
MASMYALTVEVLASDGQPLLQCDVTARGVTDTFRATYNALSGLHEFKSLPAGTYECTVTVPGYALWKKTIRMETGPVAERAILGKEGMDHYLKNNVRVPYKREDHLFGLVLRPGVANPEALLLQLEKEFGIRRLPSPPGYVRAQLFPYEYGAGMEEHAQQALRQKLQEKEGVILAAPFLERGEKSAQLLTSEVVVRFRQGTTLEQIEGLLRAHDFELLRTIPYIPNGYHLRYRGGNGYRLLDHCAQLQQTGRVEYAEPNVFTVAEQD